MRTVLYLSPLRKLCSKIEPVITLRSLALITAPARASLMCSTETMDRIWPSISNIVPDRKSLVLTTLLDQELQRQYVSVESEPCDHAAGSARGHAVRSPFLARVNVRDVNLHHRQREGLEAIVQGERIVGESAGIDDHAGGSRRLFLQEVDDLALAVALEERQFNFQLRGVRLHEVVEVGERLRAVNVRLALAEQVEVRPVDDDDLAHAIALRTTRLTRRDGTS